MSLWRQIDDMSAGGMSLAGLMVQSQRLHVGDIGTVFNLVLLAGRAVLGSKAKRKTHKKQNIKI